MNRELAEYNLKHINKCREAALAWRKANPSDPFAYRTALSHMLNGVCTTGDYHVEFKKEEIPAQFLGSSNGVFTVERPSSMHRP